MIAARIADPLPADRTPLLVGGNPIHNLSIALSVAKPIPAGKPSSQQRSRQARDLRKRSTFPRDAISACAVIQACSVSSLHMPRPTTSECFNGEEPNSFLARRADKPSRGRAMASPTAVPSSTPRNAAFRLLTDGSRRLIHQLDGMLDHNLQEESGFCAIGLPHFPISRFDRGGKFGAVH